MVVPEADQRLQQVGPPQEGAFRDALPAQMAGLLPVEVEQLVVAYATAALLAQTPVGAALLAELGLAVA